MSFYLKPPRGLVNLHTFQDCVEQRLKCYENIFHGNEEKISSLVYLVEDSPLDRTGHYLFRLLSYFNTSFRYVFLENEKKLLLLRLNCYHLEDVKYFLKRTLKHSRECLNEKSIHETVKHIYSLLVYLCSCMLRRDYLNHVFMDDHSDSDCERFQLKVPFHLCASLLFHREVNLNRGYVVIKCLEWKKLLVSVFETFLRTAIKEMRYSRNVQLVASDDRIKNVFKVIENRWRKTESCGEGSSNGIRFNVSNIDAESIIFPLCMLNLYKVLQRTNRLSHNERFDFSLFMKGIGISLSDAVRFWENAYSKQHSACSKCSHDWKNNEKRYIYGIRHLYGLEGSRKDYKVRSCNYFQEKTLSAMEDGGCPFRHFDDDNLRRILKNLLPNKEDEVEVMIYERKEHPGLSCKLFQQNVFQIVTNSTTEVACDTNFNDPVQYYLSLKRLICKQ